MKRKIYSILTAVLMLFACVFVSACGDKYKNLEFSISYAFSEDASEWYDASHGISLNYETVDDTMVFTIGEESIIVNKANFNLYFKVDIKNVAKKDVDSITVSAMDSVGLGISSLRVDENKVFKIPVTGLVNSKLNFYENNSGKSTRIDVSIYKTLEKVVINEAVKPAMTIGNSINLNSISNLVNYEPLGQTNQTGVTYELVGAGYFNSENTFISAPSVQNNFITLTNEILSVEKTFGGAGYNLTEGNNVVAIKATSIFNEEKFTTIYVYLVEETIEAPIVTFPGGVNVNDGKLQYKGLDLYYTENPSKLNYASSTVVVSQSTGLLGSGVRTSNGEVVELETVVYVDGEKFDLESLGEINGLIVTRVGENYTITVTKNFTQYKNKLTFAYEFSGFEFVGKIPEAKTDVEVRKHLLTNEITINNVDYKHNDSVDGVVYSTTSALYKGYEVKLSLNPIDTSVSNQTISLYGLTNFDVVNSLGVKYSNNGDSVKLGETLYIKFKEGVSSPKTLTFATLGSPTYYNGQALPQEFIEVSLDLSKKVTANQLEFVTYDAVEDDYVGTGETNISVNQETSIFVKAHHTGKLDTSTLKLISKNENIKFKNGSQELQLDHNSCSLIKSETGYSIYKIEMPATNVKTKGNLSVIAGEGKVGAADDLSVISVYTLEDASGIKVVPKDSTSMVEFGNNRYAIPVNDVAEFDVLDKNNNSHTLNRIKFISYKVLDTNFEIGLNPSYSATDGKDFRIDTTGKDIKTYVLDLQVYYYSYENDIITEKYEEIKALQFAVYKPIYNITAKVEKGYDNKIVYVNRNFVDAATTQIEFEAKAKDGGAPTNEVYFIDAATGTVEKIADAAQLQVAIDKDLTDVDSLKISNKVGSEFNELDLNSQVLVEDSNIKGLIRLQLIKTMSRYKDITVSFAAKRFGNLTSTAPSGVTIKFVEVEKSIGISVEGDQIVSYSQENKELQLSFMDSQTNTITGEFEVAAIYENSTLAPNTLRFDGFTYSLSKYRMENGKKVYYNNEPILDPTNALLVNIENGQVSVVVDKNIEGIGGIYKLVLATEDSYNDVTGKYDNPWALDIRVSDGGINSAYIIKTAEEFLKIGSNENYLSSHYILGDHIELGVLDAPIGVINGSIKVFNGSISGKLESGAGISSYNLYATIKNPVKSNDELDGKPYVYGLFAISTGTIKDLNAYIQFKVETNSDDNLTSKVGGLVGENRGTVENVNLYLSGNVTLNYTTMLGGVTAQNKGTIKSCYVDSSVAEKVSISTHASSDIGLVAGVNAGTIVGNYDGVGDLGDVSYDVVASLVVTNEQNNTSYNIGAVAGETISTASIQKVLVGGSIVLGDNCDTTFANLGGVAGENAGTISTVATLGLDILNDAKTTDKHYTAGIAGYSTGSITDARVIAATVKFNFSANYCFGVIESTSVVAGIAAIGNGTVENSTVESFVDKVNSVVKYTLIGSKVYALAESHAVTNSFATTNIQGTTVWLNSPNATDSTYFIGRVDATTIYKKAAYSVIYNDNDFAYYVGADETVLNKTQNVYNLANKSTASFFTEIDKATAATYIGEGKDVYVVNAEDKFAKVTDATADIDYYEFTAPTEYLHYKQSEGVFVAITLTNVFELVYNTELYTKETDLFEDWESQFNTLGSGFEINPSKNIVKVGNYEGINFYFPYLTNTQMIIAPSDISAEINQSYQINTEKNVYIDDYEDDYEIAETIIVDFFKDAFDEAINTHNLVNDPDNGQKGLIDMTILPANSTKGLRFEIIGSGYLYAYITDTNEIVFTGASNNTPIIVRAYSVFNFEAEAYFAFYSQYTYSELTLTSSDVKKVEGEDYDFETNVYLGQTGNLIQLGAINKVGNISYTTIFDNIYAREFFEIEAITELNSVLKVVADSYSSISVTIPDKDAKFANGDFELVTFNLYLKPEYFGSGVSTKQLIGTVVLKVFLYNVADSIGISGADSFEFNSNSDLNVNVALSTGYVDNFTDTREESFNIVDGNVVIVASNRDWIEFTFERNSGINQLNRLLENTGCENIVDLFDFEITSVKSAVGYNYKINLQLKNDFDYRHLTETIKLELVVWAGSNSSISSSAQITINPTTASTVRIANYAVKEINVVTSNVNSLTKGETETSIIAPGGRGNIMLIYVESPYAKIDSITITSSLLNVPTLSKDVVLMFTQLVYNQKTKRYETMYGSGVEAQVGQTLKLQDITYIDENDGKEKYSGLMYVHVQLVQFSGLEATISATLDVTSNGQQLNPYTKNLVTEFIPGADLLYKGKELNNGYLIQEDTYGNIAQIQLTGYQFNANPILNRNWEIDNGSQYFYGVDGDKNKTIDTNKEDVLLKGNLYYYTNDIVVEGKVVKAKGYYKAHLEEDLNVAGATYYSISKKDVIYKYEDGTQTGDGLIITNFVSTYFTTSYEEVKYTSNDGSHTISIGLMNVNFNVAKDIPASFTLQASLSLLTKEGELVQAYSERLLFHPTKYIVNAIEVSNTAGGNKMLSINTTDRLDLVFKTDRTDADYSSEIYNEFVKQIGLDKLADLYSFVDGETIKFSDSNKYDEFTVAISSKVLTITGVSKFNNVITFKVHYGYKLVDGKYEIVFGEKDADGVVAWEYEFSLQIYAGVNEENAIPIYYDYEMFDASGNSKLVAGGHYILMNDITVSNIKPIKFENNEGIGSLDGNNKKISITSFAVDKENTEYGLFANIGTYQDEGGKTYKSILKNVVVDYSKFEGNLEFVKNDITEVTFGGLVANNNGGLIYNCDVVNFGTSSKEIKILVDEGAEVTFGGLVGLNTGVITNSRVGTNVFKTIDSIRDTFSTQEYAGLRLSFVIGNESTRAFEAVAGGFVGKNEGEIASSYFANSSLTSYSSSIETNKTAGFVGENSGRIVYSYVKALEETIKTNVAYSTGAKIENKSNGIVAGFVYDNTGIITNSFANTVLVTDSAYIAGFVYQNNSNALISESYAACTMNSGLSIKDNAEQPFIGKNEKNEYLSFGKMENVYYLLNTGETEDTITDEIERNKPRAKGLNATNFQDGDNLIGFVFVDSNILAERKQGVWGYTNDIGQARILPELMSANTIAYSSKHLISGNGVEEKFVYTNAASFMEGSANNPYVVRSVEEFNDIFTGSRANMDTKISKTGYVRLIDNIDFKQDETAIKTRVNYTLGDANNKSNITSFEGNGMTISGIYYDVSDPSTKEIGLFANIVNAYIKNVVLEFVAPVNGNQYSTTPVKFSGGLAGTIKDSAIINVELNGKDVTLTGQNFVGGLAGIITGKSLIHGITSNLSVEAISKGQGLYYSESDYNALNFVGYNEYLNTLSYAGGIAGVIDIEKRDQSSYNVSYIDVHGDQMLDKDSGANISAQYAGGIAGFASKESSAVKLKYFVGETDKIKGNVVAGGIYAVSIGEITASQVTAVEDTQYTYDTEMGKYIIKLATDSTATLNKAAIGNTQLLESNNIVGGLIGVGLGATVNSCYSKAGIKDGTVIGGVYGVSMASTAIYAYAVPYVNLPNAEDAMIGGFAGSVHEVAKDRNNVVNAQYKEYENIVKYYLNRYKATKTDNDTDIQYTFSTLILNAEEFKNIDTSKVKLDYLAPNGREGVITSSGNSMFTNVYVASANYKNTAGSIVNNISESRNKTKFLHELYNVEKEASKQETLFLEIFASWQTSPYWSLKSEKYFPLLIADDVINYIEIASKEDFDILIANPHLDYLVIDDINMSGWKYNTGSNWILPTDFSGTLVGQMDADSKTRKKIYNMSLAPNKPGETAGLFRSTKGATVRDLEFVWADLGNGAIDMKNAPSLKEVAGLSCNDTEGGSLFSNVEVKVSRNDGEPGYLVNSSKSITGFAGLIAKTVNSDIRSCSFVGSANVILENTASNNNDVHFGGLVGSASGSTSDGMIIMSSSVGADGKDRNIKSSIFNITINKCGKANIGGAIGYAEGTSIYGNNVANVTNQVENYDVVTMNIKVTKDYNASANIGGLVGNVTTNSLIKYSDASTDIKISGETSNTDGLNVGGLAGVFDSSSGYNVESSNASTDIDISELTAKIAKISAGVGQYTTTTINEKNIYQCLFTGNIISETEILEEGASESTKYNTKVEIIYAGGIVGYAYGNIQAGNADIIIEETMSNANLYVGSTSTAALSAGGIIGKAEKINFGINNAVTAGRIVPGCGDSAGENAINVGGFVGSATTDTAGGQIQLRNSYSTSSIISDGIASKQLPNVNLDAVIGLYSTNYTVESENIYLSTDIALAENKHVSATNLNVYNLVLGVEDVWRNTFIAGNDVVWATLEKGADTNRAPYIYSIVDALKQYGIIVDNDYVEGSSLRPMVISGNKEFASKFTYYILTNAAKLSKNLNGVLIGHDVTLDFTTDNFSTNNEDTNNYEGLVSVINKHSAISNIHLNIKEQEIDITATAEFTYVGFIAGQNNGVIFNSSIQGNGIKISASNIAIGIIAGENKGLISHSYSSAEIIETTISVGGITYNNNGGINSCYFTGYINNNTKADSAGIMVNVTNNENVFVYNTYMAGVIENIAINGTSFYAETFADTMGENNYIDSLANAEYVNVTILDDKGTEDTNDDKTVNVLQTTSTFNLVSGKVLDGNWYYLDSDQDGMVDTYNGAISAVAFGINYGYPIYNFGKANGKDDTIIDLEYSLDTGKGDLSGDDQADIYGKLTSGVDYTGAYIVPHLGALSIVQGLTNKNIAIVLIYDIDVTNVWATETNIDFGQFTSWTAVGTNGEAQGFNSTTGFNGVFASNRYFKPYTNATLKDETCTITGLKGNGLFANINNAYIGGINLGSATEMDNSGLLGTEVTGNVTVTQVAYNEDSIVKGTGLSTIGGLFGEINAGTVRIDQFNTKNKNGEHALTLKDATSAGLIAGTMSGGTLVLNKDGTTSEPTNYLYPYFNKVNIAGGLIGSSNGTITISANGNNINLDLNPGIYGDKTEVSVLGGVIGENNATSTINGIVINFYAASPNINAQNFGSFVGVNNDQLTVKNNSVDNTTITSSAEEILVHYGTVGYYGLLVGQLNANATIDFNFEKISKIIYRGNSISSEDNQGAGFLVGRQGKKLEAALQEPNLTVGINYETPEISSSSSTGDTVGLTVSAENIANLGGFAGYSYGGEISVNKWYEQLIALNGTQNVGGLIGYANGTTSISASDANFFDKDTQMFEIKITEISKENFGGLYGVLAVAPTGSLVNGNKFNFSCEDEKREINVTNVGGIAGKITATLEDHKMMESTQIDVTENAKVTNIGGIAGKFTGESASDLTPSSIQFNGYSTDIDNIFNINNKEKNVILMNVGGVFGLVERANTEGEGYLPVTLTELKGATVATVQGYQNVGGLIGYANNVSLTGNIAINEGKTLDLKHTPTDENKYSVDGMEENEDPFKFNVTGVINAGGIVGYAGNGSIIQQVATQSQVIGNTNIGGLVGFANESTITNNIVGDYSTDADKTTIKGIYYNYYYEVKDSTEKDYVSYIPTSVGGLMGAANKLGEQTGNIIANVNITSTEEGKETGAYTSKSKGMISTISNYMAEISVGDGGNYKDENADFTSSSKLYILGKEGQTTRYPKFNDIVSGFGGYAGTIDKISDLSNNYIAELTINAQLGINVGTYMGSYIHDESAMGEGESIKFPSLYGTTKIDGRYNVGGVSGFVSGNVNTMNNYNTRLSGSAEIELQPTGLGMYIGGLYGKLVSNKVEQLVLDNEGDVNNTTNVKIFVNTSRSYYMGGLIGRLDVTGNNIFNNAKVVGKVTKSTSGSTDAYTDLGSAQNFGGLLGTLKVHKANDNNSGFEISVNGEHHYPFTVNTIENSNYADGGAQFSAEEDDDNVFLLAQTYYINLDSFNISATSNTKIYSAYKNESNVTVYPNNPLRPTDSKGWAKEYTGFKQVQRCITDNNGANWDSIAFVYNAEYITGVGTVENLFKGSLSTYSNIIKYDNVGDFYYYESESGEVIEDGNTQTTIVKLDPQHIIYTLYEKELGTPVLYSAIGIAEVAKYADGTLVTESTNIYSAKQEGQDDDFSGIKEYLREYVLSNPGVTGTKLDGYDKNIEKIYNYGEIKNLDYKDLLYFYWSTGYTNNEIQGDVTIDITWHEKVGGGHYAHYDQVLRYPYIYEIEDKYFHFKTIYANKTTFIRGNVNTGFEKDVAIPVSGSVFEISGLNPKLATMGGNYVEPDTSLMIAAGILALIVLVASWVLDCIGAKGLGIIGTKVSIILMSAIAVTAIVAISLFLGGLSQITAKGNKISRTMFFSTKDQNLGLLTSTISTEIRYKNDQMIGSLGEIKTKVDFDGTQYNYHFHSTTTPSDYWSDYYLAEATEEDIAKGKMTTGIPYTTKVTTINHNGKDLEHKFTTEDGKAVYKKYIYEEGMYFYNEMAVTMYKYKTPELNDSSELELESTEMYYHTDGNLYIKGYYNKTTGVYSWDNSLYDGTNRMKYSSGKYTVNGNEIAGYKDIDLEFYYAGPGSKDDSDGYLTLYGAYYTENGVVNNKNLVKYATFKYYGQTKPEIGSEGIDYVAGDYWWKEKTINADGEEVDAISLRSAYFTITTEEFKGSGEDNRILGTQESPYSDLDALKNGKITVATYPKSMNNPYKLSIDDSARDSNLYESETLETNKEDAIAVSATVRYFYFENGYMLGEDFDSNSMAYKYCGKTVYIHTDSITTDFFNGDLNLYKADGSKVYKSGTTSYTFGDIFMYSEDVKDNGIKVGENYNFKSDDDFYKSGSIYDEIKDYYLVSIKDLFPDYDTMEGKQKEAADEMLKHYKFGNTFAMKNGKVYKSNTIYSIGEDGCLYKTAIYNISADDNSYINSKYLSNVEWGLYTMFKYTDENGDVITFNFDKDTTVWDTVVDTSEGGQIQQNSKNYYVIPLSKGKRTPNRKTTYLVETCKVTFGGKLTLNHTGNSLSNGKTSGIIKIS